MPVDYKMVNNFWDGHGCGGHIGRARAGGLIDIYSWPGRNLSCSGCSCSSRMLFYYSLSSSSYCSHGRCRSTGSDRALRIFPDFLHIRFHQWFRFDHRSHCCRVNPTKVGNWARWAGHYTIHGRSRWGHRIGISPTMNSSKMSRHVILPIELFRAHSAWVRFSVQMSGHIVPVEIRRVGIGIVTYFTTISVALLRTIRANANSRATIASTRA